MATLIKTTPVLFNIVRYLGAFICSTWRKILYATLTKRAQRGDGNGSSFWRHF
ncbi:hypothetical protein KCP76_24455 [Salmonella enterica subsp. enterica serovar Weltevreden]|nr:hypothetical protein KCP76_24455 [Salmonella enterica subsp. enterica serovar Weltevreden]